MQGGGIIKCLDKQVPVILYNFFHQSYILGSKRPTIKRRSPLLTFQSHFTNILNNILEKPISWGPCASVKQFLQDNISGYNTGVITLMDLFQLDRNTAKSIVSKNAVFAELPKKIITNNYKQLIHAGMNKALILQNVLLLAEDCTVLQKKIEIIQKFVYIIDYSIPFFYHDVSTLTVFIRFTKIKLNDSIENIFERKEQIKTKEVYAILSKYLCYLTYEHEATVKKINLLLDYKISVDSLIQEDWPMYCNYNHIKIRLEKCSDVGILPPLKPWILTCKEETFNKKLNIDNLKKSKSDKMSEITDFLTKRSNYSKELINFKIRNFPNHSPHFNEIRNTINIIINEGYEYHDIIWEIKVLALSKKIIVDRFCKLQSINHKAPFLSVLLLSEEDFINYVNTKRK